MSDFLALVLVLVLVLSECRSRRRAVQNSGSGVAIGGGGITGRVGWRGLTPFEERGVFATMGIKLRVGQGIEHGRDWIGIPACFSQLMLDVVCKLHKVLLG